MHFEFDALPLWDHLRLHRVHCHRIGRRGTSLRAVQEVWLSYDVTELRDAYRRDRNRAIRQLVNNRGRLRAIAALQRAEAKVEQTSIWDVAA